MCVRYILLLRYMNMFVQYLLLLLCLRAQTALCGVVSLCYQHHHHYLYMHATIMFAAADYSWRVDLIVPLILSILPFIILLFIAILYLYLKWKHPNVERIESKEAFTDLTNPQVSYMYNILLSVWSIVVCGQLLVCCRL